MHAPKPLPPTITERLTWAEMCERYPDEWVCVVDIHYYDDPNIFAFRTARVVGHHKTKHKAFDQARPWCEQYDLIRSYFTGTLIIRAFPRIILDDETRDALRHKR